VDVKAENIRQAFSSDALQKLIHHEWSIPPVEKVMPWFFAVATGFVSASLAAFVVTSALMPKHSKNKNATTRPLEPIPINLPAPPLTADFENISKRNLFNSEGAMADAKDGKIQCELRKSEMPLKFSGVIFGGTAATSLAVIESVSTKQAETFLLHDLVPGQATIVDIGRFRVILERNGCQEYLDLEAEPLPKRRVAGTKSSRGNLGGDSNLGADSFKEDGFLRKGNKISVERRWVDKALGIDFAKTLQDAKANPNLVGAEIKGFILTKIRPNSVYEKMGLKDGDVVKNINGIELSGMAQAVQTLNQMRNEATISLTVDRSGQTLNFNLDIRR
jgi:general secretion pathway protein C